MLEKINYLYCKKTEVKKFFRLPAKKKKFMIFFFCFYVFLKFEKKNLLFGWKNDVI